MVHYTNKCQCQISQKFIIFEPCCPIEHKRERPSKTPPPHFCVFFSTDGATEASEEQSTAADPVGLPNELTNHKFGS